MIKRPLTRPRRWLILFVVFVALPSGTAAQMPDFSGCRSVQGDDWFVDVLAFAPLTIAPGVTVEPFGDGLRLSNTTQTPLYLVEAFVDPQLYAAAAPISLTEPLGVSRRVVSGTVEVWTPTGYGGVNVWRRRDASSITIGRDHLIPVFPDYRSLQRYGDNRLPNALPPAATYTLRVVYGDELIAIPVTQTYRLNPNYDPNKERVERERCEHGAPIFMVLVAWCMGMPTGVLLVLSLGVICIIDRRLLQRRRG